MKHVGTAGSRRHPGKDWILRSSIPAWLIVGLCTCYLNVGATSVGSDGAYVRINGVGYISGEQKRAILLAPAAEDGATFRVVNDSTNQAVIDASIGPAQGAWSPFYPYTYALDFSALRTPGRYSIQVDGPVRAASPEFRIGAGKALYSRLLANASFFYRAQRDGPNVDPQVLHRQPSHLADAAATAYETPQFVGEAPRFPLQPIGGPVDASGGWNDAGDYMKFVETASYTEAIMLLSLRQHPAAFKDGSSALRQEARFGLDWLQKMWDPHSKTLYYQVGIGDGSGAIEGDHDRWRLPQADDELQVTPGSPDYYLKYRPVFRAGPPGSLISPNLAGRLAADFALACQLYHATDPAYARRCLFSAETIYDLSQTAHVEELLTTAPHSFYPETEWRDDMELGAVELYFATRQGTPPGMPHREPGYYLAQAAHWASEYMQSPNNGNDSLNLYDVSGIAHWDLCRALELAPSADDLEVNRQDVLDDLKEQIDRGAAQAAKDPFRLGIVYGSSDAAPHALGLAVEAHLYDELTRKGVYGWLERSERNWVLGENAWGTSFIVGAGAVFPHYIHHQIANLSGSLCGSGALLLGATVDGPAPLRDAVGLSASSSMIVPAVPAGSDPFGRFTGHNVRFQDRVTAWPNVEPADDYTALTILLFAQQEEARPHA